MRRVKQGFLSVASQPCGLLRGISTGPLTGTVKGDLRDLA